MDEITERRHGKAAENIRDSIDDAMHTLKEGVGSNLPKEFAAPDFMSALSPEGQHWANSVSFIMGNGVSALIRNGLTKDQAFATMRKMLDFLEFVFPATQDPDQKLPEAP